MSALSPVHTIGEHFFDVIAVHRPGVTKEESRDRTVRLLRLVGLGPEVVHSYPHELSGGMVQRVSIALSLVHDPQLLIMDEATTALDVITQAQILELIKRLQQQLGVTALLITHDLSVVGEVADRVAVMYAGHLVEVGPVDAVMGKPRHPYTMALMGSIPREDTAPGSLRGIPGTLPDLTATQTGCVFVDRCPRAQADCRRAQPPLVPEAGGRWTACLHPLVSPTESATHV